MARAKTSRLLSLPVFGGTTQTHTAGSLSDPQVASLRALAAEPGIVFHVHRERILKDGRPSRWVCLVTRPGEGLTAVAIELDGTRSR